MDYTRVHCSCSGRGPKGELKALWQYICLELSQKAASYHEQLKRIKEEFYTRHNTDIEAVAPRNPG